MTAQLSRSLADLPGQCPHHGRDSVRRDSVRRDSVRRGSVRRGSVRRDSVRRGSVRRDSDCEQRVHFLLTGRPLSW